MKSIGSIALLTLALSGSLLAAQEKKEKQPSRSRLGERIPPFAYRDATGKLQRVDPKEHRAVVAVFLSFNCPMSNGYSAVLADLAKANAKNSVAFVGLTLGDETPEQLAKLAKDFRLPFPIGQDVDLAAATALDAQVTPEAFVLDSQGVLRYRGRIDNGYSERLKKHAQTTRHDLKEALAEVLAGKPVTEPATVAFGCFIPRAEKPREASSKYTYHRDVQPILQNHCQPCHRPGEVGPFSLMTYKQAVNWADDIKTYTSNRAMPPWKPSASVAFQNERKLSEREIAILREWADGGTPQGDPKDAPAPRVFTEGWQLGTPDLVLAPTGEFTLGPNGRDVFRCFVMPTGLPEDVHVTAVEVRPGNPRIVHHVLLFIDQTGAARKLETKAQAAEKPAEDATPNDDDSYDKGPGYTVAMGVGFIPQGGLTGWAPGNQGRHFPENSGILLPKGADVVMQVHYHRDGRIEHDKTQVGLYFAKKPVTKPFGGGVIAGRTNGGIFGTFFSIPAGDANFKLSGDSWAHKDFTLYTVMPHMHMIGKSIKVTMTSPEGKIETLIDIPAWDYNWQETYFLKEPLRIKQGTKFHVEAVYDNSDKNPLNPFNPPRRITMGEQTFNEMCFVFLGGSSEQPWKLGRGRVLPMWHQPPAKAGEASAKD
jgi:peroxiredoxin